MVAFSLSLVSQLAAFITLCLEQGPNDGGGDDGNGGDEEEGDKLENVQVRFVRRKVRRVFRWWLRNIRLGDTETEVVNGDEVMIRYKVLKLGKRSYDGLSGEGTVIFSRGE